ncbi:MAG: MBL fold metallo-hydrolase, partial [Dehalococcoidia bacterium]
MAVEVAPGVWWLEGTRGCNVYLARARDGTFVLVDAAHRSSAGAIVREAHAIAGDAPVTHLLLTHRHFDHTGAAVEVARALSARIAIGEGDCEAAPDGGRQVVMRRGAPVPVDLAIAGRCEVAPGIEAVPAPGHTPGSMCFVAVDAGAAFVGDLVISYGDGLARAMVAANGDDGRYLETLRRFAEEAPPVGLPGHGYPVRGDFAAALRDLADSPREPLTPRNALRRARRMMRFSTFMWMR